MTLATIIIFLFLPLLQIAERQQADEAGSKSRGVSFDVTKTMGTADQQKQGQDQNQTDSITQMRKTPTPVSQPAAGLPRSDVRQNTPSPAEGDNPLSLFATGPPKKSSNNKVELF